MVSRTVHSPDGAGIFLAVDEAALAKLTEPDAYPVHPKYYRTPVPKPNIQDQNGLMFAPNGYKARVTDRKFLVHGRLIDPFPANTLDMMKAGAVEVERIEWNSRRSKVLKGRLGATVLDISGIIRNIVNFRPLQNVNST